MFLFHRIGRELNAAYRPLLADLGLTHSQYLVDAGPLGGRVPDLLEKL